MRSLHEHCTYDTKKYSNYKFLIALFKELHTKYAKNKDDIKFVKIDVDKCADVAQQQGISAMPTFQIFKKGEKIAGKKLFFLPTLFRVARSKQGAIAQAHCDNIARLFGCRF